MTQFKISRISSKKRKAPFAFFNSKVELVSLKHMKDEPKKLKRSNREWLIGELTLMRLLDRSRNIVQCGNHVSRYLSNAFLRPFPKHLNQSSVLVKSFCPKPVPTIMVTQTISRNGRFRSKSSSGKQTRCNC